MAIYMTRHGQTDWNVQKRVQGKADIELNENGIEQAQLTSEKFKDIEIDLIICSPLKRAKQTAEIINRVTKCEIIYEDGVSERDFGEFEGKNKENFDFNGYWSYKKIINMKKLKTYENFSIEYIEH